MTQSQFIQFDLPNLPPRPDDSHKGTYGTVVVVGGCDNMIGAPALTASAALRTGAGLVKIATPLSILNFVLTLEPCAIGIGLTPEDTDNSIAILQNTLDDKCVLAVGPGMGLGNGQRKLITHLLSQSQPVILDADALNNLALLKLSPFTHNCPLILTPHPGEFSRLADAFNINLSPTDENQRPAAAAELAIATQSVVVLKGQHTIVTDGTHLYKNTTGHSVLSTAGSGDVLTGIISSLVAQGLSTIAASALGVYIHGHAGEAWAALHGQSGMKATDLIANQIPMSMQDLRDQQ